MLLRGRGCLPRVRSSVARDRPAGWPVLARWQLRGRAACSYAATGAIGQTEMFYDICFYARSVFSHHARFFGECNTTFIRTLAGSEEATSREIEIGTGLRQPEVSVGVRTLHENKWVTEYEIRSERKGRPMKVYSLSTSLDEILRHYDEEKCHESTSAMEAIQRLKVMAAN